MDEDILEITFFKKTGDQIRKFVFSADCIGQIIVKGSTLDECRAKINKIYKKRTTNSKESALRPSVLRR